MIKFIYETPESHLPFTAVSGCTIEVEDERSLDEMLSAYVDFLRAIGFGIPVGAYLQIAEDEV